MKKIIGINMWSHDTSACLVENGSLVCAVEEERFNGEKHTTKFPTKAISSILKSNNLTIDDITDIAVGWDFKSFVRNQFLIPANKREEDLVALPNYFERIIGFLNSEKIIRDELNFQGNVKFVKHHLAHSEFAEYSSQSNNCISIVVDGYGDEDTTTIYKVKDGIHEKVYGINFPNSLGLVYQSVTDFLGFIRNCDEGIIMGLAAYGNAHEIVQGLEKSYIDVFREIVADDEDTVFKLDQSIFPFGNARKGFYSDIFIDIFGNKRLQDESLTMHHKNIAAALQLRTEEVLERLLKFSERFYETETYLLSGGVALNCVANHKLRSGTGLVKKRNVHVPQNPGDAGVAIGAALNLSKSYGIKTELNQLTGLGPKYSEADITKAVNECKGFNIFRDNIEDLMIDNLMRGKICSLFHGGSEFGPRALGHRSIITAPFPGGMKDILNARVKFREEFRPFAPIVREEDANIFFEMNFPSPYMMFAVPIRELRVKDIPAVAHVDDTGRVQTVNKRHSPYLYGLLDKFERQSKIPVLLNTSFNVKGQPIVETPKQAIDTFMGTNIDCLLIPPFFLAKN